MKSALTDEECDALWWHNMVGHWKIDSEQAKQIRGLIRFAFTLGAERQRERDVKATFKGSCQCPILLPAGLPKHFPECVADTNARIEIANRIEREKP